MVNTKKEQSSSVADDSARFADSSHTEDDEHFIVGIVTNQYETSTDTQKNVFVASSDTTDQAKMKHLTVTSTIETSGPIENYASSNEEQQKTKGNDEDDLQPIPSSTTLRRDTHVHRNNNSNNGWHRLPGAYAVDGVNAAQVEEQRIRATRSRSQSIDSSSNEACDFVTSASAVVREDEGALRARIESRIQERLQRQTIEATNVQGVDLEGGSARGETSLKKMESLQDAHKRCSWALLAFGSIVMIIILSLFFASSASSDHPDGEIVVETQAPEAEDFLSTPSPTKPPRISDLDYVRNIVLLKTELNGTSNSTSPVYDESSSQYQAISWIVNDDPLFQNFKDLAADTDANLTTSSSSIQGIDETLLWERYVIVLLHFATDGPSSWNQQIALQSYNFLSNVSICDWHHSEDSSTDGIYCDDDSLVRSIRLGEYRSLYDTRLRWQVNYNVSQCQLTLLHIYRFITSHATYQTQPRLD